MSYTFKVLYSLLEHETQSELKELVCGSKSADYTEENRGPKVYCVKKNDVVIGHYIRGYWYVYQRNPDYHDYMYLIYEIVYHNGFRYAAKRRKKTGLRHDLLNYDGTACVVPDDAIQLRWHVWAAVCLMKMAKDTKHYSNFMATLEQIKGRAEKA